MNSVFKINNSASDSSGYKLFYVFSLAALDVARPAHRNNFKRFQISAMVVMLGLIATINTHKFRRLFNGTVFYFLRHCAGHFGASAAQRIRALDRAKRTAAFSFPAVVHIATKNTFPFPRGNIFNSPTRKARVTACCAMLLAAHAARLGFLQLIHVMRPSFLCCIQTCEEPPQISGCRESRPQESHALPSWRRAER